VSREIRTTADHNNPKEVVDFTSEAARRPAIANERTPSSSIKERMELAIIWLRVLAEEQTRTVVSRVSSGLLIADRLAAQVPEIKAAAAKDQPRVTAGADSPAQAATPEWTGAADGLARTIYETLSSRVSHYGIHVEEVSLREIRLPEEIVQECVAAAKAAYLPLLAQRKASAAVASRRAELTAEVELLGREAVATREIVANAPAFGLVDFLSQYLKNSLNAQSAQGALGLTAIAAAAMAGSKLPPPAAPAHQLPSQSDPTSQQSPGPSV
jgi:regulator of protease activity HflC (stomatin/prohibitin superfamily)